MRKATAAVAAVIVISLLSITPADARRGYTEPPADIAAIYQAASAESGVPYSTLVKIASCESGHNPAAKNRRSSASGLFQQIKRYWPGRVRSFNQWHQHAPLENTNIFDPVTNTRVSAFMMQDGRGTRQHWRACS